MTESSTEKAKGHQSQETENEVFTPKVTTSEEKVRDRNIDIQKDSMPVKPHTSFINIIVIATACIGGFNYGYGANIIAGSLAQTSFIAKFLSSGNTAATVDGMLTSYLAGAFIGAVIQAPLSNKFGRRGATAIAAILIIISGALQCGSVKVGMFITFRIINGIGGGMVISNSPVYMSEVSPPHTRGMLVGCQGIGIVCSYILCALMALCFSFVTQDYQWRMNFIILTFFGLCLLGSLYWLPESPRWLFEKGRAEEAKKVLEYLHTTKSDPEGRVAKAEFIQIKAQVETEMSLPSGYLYILRTPHLRKRALVTILLWTMAQGTGITCIANLTPTLMGNLGFRTTMQLGLGVAWTSCLIVGCAFNIYFLDRVGRVKLLVAGGLGSCILLSTEAALEKYYLNSGNTAGINAAVAIYFLFGTYFTTTIECTAYVYGSEIWPTYLRSHGSTLAYASFFANSIAYSAPATVAFDGIGWKYYMVFVAVTAPFTAAVWWLFPETKGLPLEEINGLFGDKVEITFKDAFYDDSIKTTE